MSSRRRYQDWRERLAAFFAEAQDKPFVWGEHDCALFAANAVAAQLRSGDDFGAAFRGQYNDAKGAEQALAAIGSGNLEATVTSYLGGPLPSKAKAQSGDIVLFESGQGPALGVVDHSGVMFAAVTPGGLARLPLRRAIVAWRV